MLRFGLIKIQYSLSFGKVLIFLNLFENKVSDFDLYTSKIRLLINWVCFYFFFKDLTNKHNVNLSTLLIRLSVTARQ